MQFEIGDAPRHRAVRAGQETRAHAVSDIAETQVEACRLNLVGREVARGDDRAACAQRRDHAVGQDPLVAHGKSQGVGGVALLGKGLHIRLGA